MHTRFILCHKSLNLLFVLRTQKDVSVCDPASLVVLASLRATSFRLHKSPKRKTVFSFKKQTARFIFSWEKIKRAVCFLRFVTPQRIELWLTDWKPVVLTVRRWGHTIKLKVYKVKSKKLYSKSTLRKHYNNFCKKSKRLVCFVYGSVAEWFKASLSKSDIRFKANQGFKSSHFRNNKIKTSRDILFCYLINHDYGFETSEYIFS